MNNIHSKVEPSSKILRWFFFISGIVATIAYRVIFLLDSFWIDVVWYIGTIGFMIYFGHRARVEYKRAKLVEDHNLIEVIEKSQASEEKKSALLYLVKTSVTSKARFNSAFIFIASAVVFVAALIKDLYPLFF